MNTIYHDSPFLSKLKNQPRKKPVCLFSDIDDTYMIKYNAPPTLLESLSQKKSELLIDPDPNIYKDTEVLYRFLEENNIPLCLVSGRDMYQFEGLSQELGNKLPALTHILFSDIFIGAVGTEIWVRQTNGSYLPDEEYRKHIIDISDFRRETIYDLAKQAIDSLNKLLPLIFLSFQKRDQEPAPLDEYPPQPLKVSLKFDSDVGKSEQVKIWLYDYFQKLGKDKIHIVISFGHKIDPKNNRYNVDILPCNKATPVNYLSRIFDLQPVTAGDSGNDTDMLLHTNGFAIAVGGSKKELVDRLSREKTRKDIYIETKHLTGPSSLKLALQTYLLRT